MSTVVLDWSSSGTVRLERLGDLLGCFLGNIGSGSLHRLPILRAHVHTGPSAKSEEFQRGKDAPHFPEADFWPALLKVRPVS